MLLKVFKILTIIFWPPRPLPLPPHGVVWPRGVPGISTASLTGRVLKFKFVKKYCLVDYIQQITVTPVTTVQTFSIKTTSKGTTHTESNKHS